MTHQTERTKTKSGDTTIKTFPFFMALVPYNIVRSVMVLETKNGKELVSCTFIAQFRDAGERYLNSKKWQPIGLLRESDKGDCILSNYECCLYFKDWSNSPIFGDFKKDYPKIPLIPKEVTDLYLTKSL